MSDTLFASHGHILEQLANAIPAGTTVLDVRVGPFLTAVRTNLGTGVSATFVDTGPNLPRPRVERAGSLRGMSAHELVMQSIGGSVLERSIAVAAINASQSPRLPVTEEGNGHELICRLGAGKRVMVIGHFPFVDRPGIESFASLEVFELPHRLKTGDSPSEQLPLRAKQAEVVVITGTTLLTDTLVGVLAAFRGATWRLMMGPTTPLSPVLHRLGIDWLCGSVVDDEPSTLQAITEGATHKQLTGLRKVICGRQGEER